MPNPADLPADDHRTQLRALLAQADDYAAALNHVVSDDPRRLLDVARQMTTWHGKLAAVLLSILSPEAERGMAVAGALTALAEAVPFTHANAVSAWEHAARQFDPQPPGQDQA